MVRFRHHIGGDLTVGRRLRTVLRDAGFVVGSQPMWDRLLLERLG